MRFRDAAGNTTSDVNDTIVLGPTLPTVSATNAGTGWTTNTGNIITLTTTAGGAGLNYSRYAWNTSDTLCRSAGVSFPNGQVISIVSQ